MVLNFTHCLPGLRGAAFALALALAGPALAQTADAPLDPAADLMGQTQAWVDQAVVASRPVGAAPLRMVVSVGALDSRLTLAPCAQVEPYLPPGTRLWGKTRLGLRCLDASAHWNVFLPIHVQAFGPAWVIRGDQAPGAVLTEDAAVQAEVDWAQESNSILADSAMWVGQTATRRLRTGEPLRYGMVKASQVFQAGTLVRIVADGPGFRITSDGQALSAGVVGEMARVRIDSGRVLSGLVLDGRTVKVNL